MAIAIDQVATLVEDGDEGASTVITFGTSPAVGSLVVIPLAGYNPANYGTPTVADNKGNTYTVESVVQIGGGGPVYSVIAWAKATSAGGTFTVTVTHQNASGSYVSAGAASWTGYTNPVVDKKATAQGAASGTSLTVGPTATTTANDELVVGCLAMDGGGGLWDDTVNPSGYTELWIQGSSAGVCGQACYKIVAVTGAQSAVWTNLTSGISNGGSAGGVVTFKEGSAGGVTGTGAVTKSAVLAATGAYLLLEQEGFRFYNDDGSESAATAAGAQDANVTLPLGQNFRLRFIINATGDPPSTGYQLEFRKQGETPWVAVT